MHYVQWLNKGRRCFRAFRNPINAWAFIQTLTVPFILGDKRLKYNAHRDWRGA